MRLTSYSKHHGSWVETGTEVHEHLSPLEWEQGESQRLKTWRIRHSKAPTGTHRHKLFLNQGKIRPRGSYVKRSGRIYAVFGKAAGGKGFLGPITKLVLFMQPWEYEAPSLSCFLCHLWNIKCDKDQHNFPAYIQAKDTGYIELTYVL